LFIYATEYSSLVVAPAARYSEALASLLGVAPYLGFWLLLWREAYPLQGVLFGRSGTRAAFIKAHARMELPVAAPWLVILVLGDLLRWAWPEADKALAANPGLDLFYTPLFLLLAGVFMPVLVKNLWGCTPVPEGELRERLVRITARTGLRVREILFWPLLEGRVLTAGIVGLLPRYRYLLITPALTHALSPDELDGVVAHEAGHVRHRHLWFYLFFFSGILVCGLGIFFQLASAGLLWWDTAFPEAAKRHTMQAAASLALTLGMAAVLFLGLRVFFGFISRAFERQSDLHALETLANPEPIISALETISRYSGDIRDLPSWHHGSVGERVAFLGDVSLDPSLGQEHHRYVRRLMLGSGVLVALLIATMAWLYSPPTTKALELFARRSGLERYLASNPGEVQGWVALGALRYEEGDEQKALTAFRRALGRDPRNPEALNGAAWILVTTKSSSLYSPREALVLAQRAAARTPAPHILDTLAEAYFAVGDAASALAAMEQALAQTPPGHAERSHYETQRERFRSALKR
jgi:Zn-dependent protease with chaperone function